jgi:DNA-binding NarL/FixJ family response regulator
MANGVQRANQPRHAREKMAGPTALSGSACQKKALVVIDRRTLFRDCLARCLRTADANHVVLAFASVTEWLEAAPHHPPAGVIVLCTLGSDHAYTEAARDLALLSSAHTDVPLVLVSDGEDVDHVISALEWGARGYIPTSVTLDVAIGAMNVVEAGGTFVPAASLVASKRMAGTAAGQNGHSCRIFTARQAAVLEALRRGKPNKQIAYDLNMRESTVKLHVRNIMRKLKAKNRTEAALLSSSLVEDLGHR